MGASDIGDHNNRERCDTNDRNLQWIEKHWDALEKAASKKALSLEGIREPSSGQGGSMSQDNEVVAEKI